MKARNDNVIDCYINKGDNDTNEQVCHYVAMLTYKYFITLTDKIVLTTRPNKLDFLFDENFAELVNGKINELGISEYYMISASGSFLLANRHNKYVLIVYDDAALDEFCEMSDNEPLIKDFAEAVKMRKLIPFFGINKYPEDIALADWKTKFYTANKHFDYFWSLIQI